MSREHEVSCKVRLEDVFQVKPRHSRSRAARDSDRFKDELAQVTGVNRLRVPARSQYDPGEIQRSLYVPN